LLPGEKAGRGAEKAEFWNQNGDHSIMNRNILYGIIAVLAVASAVVGYQLYQERQKTTGVQISVGERGISIEKK